jgi:hypothetical protein
MSATPNPQRLDGSVRAFRKEIRPDVPEVAR